LYSGIVSELLHEVHRDAPAAHGKPERSLQHTLIVQ